MTPAGIKPATFWFVAQHLNHCATAVHTVYIIKKLLTEHAYISVWYDVSASDNKDINRHMVNDNGGTLQAI